MKKSIKSYRDYRLTCIAVILISVILTTLSPLYPNQQLLQHLGTLVVMLPVILDLRSKVLSRSAILGITVFSFIHVMGARYIYSYVPYNEWSVNLTGFDIQDFFNFDRNHYDRFVHFSFGLLILPYTRDLVKRYFGITKTITVLLIAWLFIQTFSMLYELFEWSLTVFMTENMAENYNGQQGDIWDAHKDMALASLGALAAMTATAIINMSLQRDFAREWAESLKVKRSEPLGEYEIRRMREERGDQNP